MLIGPVLALDQGATNARAAVVWPDGSLATRRGGALPAGQDRAAAVAFITALLRDVRDEHGRSGATAPVAIGISAPGPLDGRAGVLIEPPNLPRDWWGYPLGPSLGDTLDLPWALERDTVGTILGEWCFGAGRGSNDLVYMTVSTGVGGAVISDGRLLLGPDGVAGELGHMIVDMDGPPCGCGGRGHVESFASGTGIARAARAALEDGTAGRPLWQVAEAVGVDAMTAQDVARAADLGDRAAGVILGDARRAVAYAAVSLVNVFAPDMVILGGGITLAWGERMLEPAREAVAQLAFRIPAARARVVIAALGDDGGLAGAVPLVARALPGLATTTANHIPPDS